MSTQEFESIKELFEEKLKSIHIQLDSEFAVVNNRLAAIEEQTRKTNGRITKLEELSNIHTLAINTQQINCPNTKKISEMDKNMEDVNFFIRHPKLFIAGMATVILLTIATFINSNPFKVFEKVKTPVQTELVK
jgi:hypothetical protein